MRGDAACTYYENHAYARLDSEKMGGAGGMKSSQELKKQLRQIDHKGYKAYKVLEG